MHEFDGVVPRNPSLQRSQMPQALTGFINLCLKVLTPEAISDFVETVEEENT